MKPPAWRDYRDHLDADALPVVSATPLRELDTIRLNLLCVHLLQQGRRHADRDGLMFAYCRAELAAGREPTAKAAAAAGGMTYDGGRKALTRYRRAQVPRQHDGGSAPKTIRNVHVMLHGAFADPSVGICFHATRRPTPARGVYGDAGP
ncbi:hypothetical protein ACQPZQ_05855 [Pseudonocardia sp. CA-142604]|uniref:hypothetical protein n=1 Tax=Pseudonocardia sp. CA-142604 TaxID=3240024 RepID=UPI003D8F37CE